MPAHLPRVGAPLVAGLAASLVAGAGRAEPVRFELDPAHTALAFLVEHVGYAKVIGRFDDVTGSLVWDEAAGELSELRVVVVTASVDTGDEARDEHLRKADFLDVAKHPEMVFTASALAPRPAPDAEDGADGTASGSGADGDDAPVLAGTVEGTLELLGRTRPLALDVTLNKAADYPFGHAELTLGVSARGALSRSDWGMDYGVANALVGDEVELLIETEAIRE